MDKESRKRLGIKCTSLLLDTDENYETDKTKVYFHFVDYPNEAIYKGAITWTELFTILKPHLTKIPQGDFTE